MSAWKEIATLPTANGSVVTLQNRVGQPRLVIFDATWGGRGGWFTANGMAMRPDYQWRWPNNVAEKQMAQRMFQQNQKAA